MLQRRLITIPLLFLIAAVCTLLFVPVLLIALLLSLLPQLRCLPHVWALITGYLIFECIGVLRLTWTWLRYRGTAQWIRQDQLVQIWWSDALFRMAAKIFRLRVEVTGTDAVQGPSAIVFVRHCSLGDTVLPFPYFAVPRNYEGLRYILKRELMISPSLDIGAHRLSSLFVDRSGRDTKSELEQIRMTTATASDDESVLIYPEGTRQSVGKRRYLRKNYPELIPQLDRWPDLLPPRLGGMLAMLKANPGKDIVLVAHTGFEGSANLAELLSGSWRDMLIRIHTWRIPYADIPDDHESFIFEQWDLMQHHIARLSVDARPLT